MWMDVEESKPTETNRLNLNKITIFKIIYTKEEKRK